MANGYYQMLAREPVVDGGGALGRGLGQMFANARNAKMQERLFQQKERQLQAEQAADVEAQRLKEQQATEERQANIKRTAAQMIRANPQNAPQVARMLQANNIDPAPFMRPQPSQVQIADEAPIQAQATGDFAQQAQPTPQEMAMGLDMSAAGPLGAPDPQKQQRGPALDAVGKQVRLMFGHQPDTPEFRREYANVMQMQQAAEVAKAQARAGKDPSESLRKEFYRLPVVKDTEDVLTAYQKVKGARKGGPGDMNLIFGYMKMLDPGSAVREGEFANAENAQGVPERVRGMYNRIIDGARLGDTAFLEFKREAAKVAEAQVSRYENYAGEYRRLAKVSGVAPENVVLDIGVEGVMRGKGGASEQTRPRRTVNGETREWDGQKWVPVQ